MCIISSRIALVLALVFLARMAPGQVSDFGVWTSLGLKKKITRDLSAIVHQDLRLYENAGEIGTVLTDAGAEYEVTRALKAELHYRYIRKKRVDDFYETRHRWYADVSYRHREKPLVVTVRERFQSQFRPVRNDTKSRSPENVLRSKVTLSADLDRKYEPFLAFEWALQLNHHARNEVEGIRYLAGVEYAFSKRHSLQAYYMINRELNVNAPVTDYVVGLDARYSF